MGKLKRNFAYASAYKLLELLLPIITSPLLSRRLGAEMLGIYTYTYSISSMFSIVAQLGAYRYGMREIAKVRDDRDKVNHVYSDIFFTRAANGLAVCVFYLLFIFFFGGQYRLIFLVQGLGIISNMLDNSFLFVGMEELKAVTIRDAAVKLLSFALILAFIREPEDLLKYVVLMSVSSLLCKMIALIYGRRFAALVSPEVKNCRYHYRHMFVLMVPVISSGIYQSMDKIMIGALYNNSDVGYYECASKALTPKNIITVFGTVLCPRITNLYAQGKREEAIRSFYQSMQLSLVMAYAFMFGIAAVANEFAPLFWGEDFAVCGSMIIGLSVTIPLWTVGEVIRNQYLLPNGRDHEYTLSFVIGVVVNAIMNVALIAPFGAMGAIAATIAAELTMSAAQMFFVRKEINVWNGIVKTAPYFIFGMVMVLVVRRIAALEPLSLLLRLIVEICVGGCLYIVLCLGYEVIFKKPLLVQVLRKGKRNGD